MTLRTNRLTTYRDHPETFRADIEVDAGGTVAPFGPLQDQWQREDFAATDGGWKRAIGIPCDDGCSRAWLERPRGHSKSSDLAMMATWALFFAPQKITGAAAAGDRDQAKLLRDAIDRLVRLNPMLARRLTVNKFNVENSSTGSTLDILSADAPTAYGLILDCLLVDEAGNWGESGASLWDALFSTIAKRERCFCCVITNAGFQDSWQWRLRESIRQSPGWHFNSLEGPQASWITEQLLDEQRRLLPPLAFDRLWLNRWTASSGDALIAGDIDRIFMDNLAPMERDPAYAYAAGLDLSVSRDHSAFVVIAKSRKEQRYRVAQVYLWKPPKGGRIDLEQVEATILQEHKRYGFKQIGADPFQAEYLLARLRKAGINAEDRPQTGRALVEQCQLLLETINSGALTSYRHSQLEHDLRHLRIESRSYGVRLVSDRGLHGHGDVATALTIGLATAKNCKTRGAPIISISNPRPVSLQERFSDISRPRFLGGW